MDHLHLCTSMHLLTLLFYYYYCCCTVCTALLFSYSAIFIAASVRNKLIHSFIQQQLTYGCSCSSGHEIQSSSGSLLNTSLSWCWDLKATATDDVGSLIPCTSNPSKHLQPSNSTLQHSYHSANREAITDLKHPPTTVLSYTTDLIIIVTWASLTFSRNFIQKFLDLFSDPYSVTLDPYHENLPIRHQNLCS